jgi:hypothetical protein
MMGDAGDGDGESLCERMRLKIMFVVSVSEMKMERRDMRRATKKTWRT